MKYTVPDYYHKFQCIAGDCPATCCAGWQIVIDERSLERYKKQKGPFGNRLANSIDWDEGVFLQYNGRCAFLDENNLCDIYSEAGPHMFCRTCRNYPRHIEEFENEREISLSLSCPVAADLILGRTEKVKFLTAERACDEEEDEEFDFFLYSALQDCRSAMIEILQDRREPVAFRMAKVLALAHDVQNRIDARKIFEVETLLERYMREGANEKLKKKIASYNKAGVRMERSRSLLGLLDELEVLDPSWPAQLAGYRSVLYGAGSGGYEKAAKTGPDFETELEQLMVYFIFTYFCGAVYDGDALAKVKMAVACTLILRELWMADRELLIRMDAENTKERAAGEPGMAAVSAAKANAKESAEGKAETADVNAADCAKKNGRQYDSMARNRVAWRFSRELEHSDPNLDKMELLMNESEAASFEVLLELIMSR